MGVCFTAAVLLKKMTTTLSSTWAISAGYVKASRPVEKWLSNFAANIQITSSGDAAGSKIWAIGVVCNYGETDDTFSTIRALFMGKCNPKQTFQATIKWMMFEKLNWAMKLECGIRKVCHTSCSETESMCLEMSLIIPPCICLVWIPAVTDIIIYYMPKNFFSYVLVFHQ